MVSKLFKTNQLNNVEYANYCHNYVTYYLFITNVNYGNNYFHYVQIVNFEKAQIVNFENPRIRASSLGRTFLFQRSPENLT